MAVAERRASRRGVWLVLSFGTDDDRLTHLLMTGRCRALELKLCSGWMRRCLVGLVRCLPRKGTLMLAEGLRGRREMDGY